MEYRIKMLEGECFFGGSTVYGTKNPYDASSEEEFDFREWHCHNQTMPMFLSTKGRYIYSENPFKVTFHAGEIILIGEDVQLIEAGDCLRDAYLAAMRTHFPFDGRRLPDTFFTTAQYNTWMEHIYFPTQEKVLEYAHGVVDNGFTPGILIIDEGWHGRYGEWEFDFARFPDPKAMVDELHALGFKLMLWVVPFVSPDGYSYACSTSKVLGGGEDAKNLYIRNAAGAVAIFRWWNGYSAMLDFRKECDCRFLKKKLDHLMNDYGVDGFKFDGGSVGGYQTLNLQNGAPRADHDPHALNRAWNDFGTAYEYHEYKDSYKCGGINSIQRLCDRTHSWDENGIATLVPSAIVQGLCGHPFICPDMIGGGSWAHNVDPEFKMDEELFVRMAEASALMPMMQFSWAPWRVLSPEALAMVKAASDLHLKMADEILALVRRAETEGEPILRSLEYADPHQGYERITDEFMLGEDILVAPVLTKGITERDVVFPKGTWADADGVTYAGRAVHRIKTPLGKLAYFRRVK